MDVSARCRIAILEDLTAGLVRRETAITQSAGRPLQALQLLAENSARPGDGVRGGAVAAVDAWVSAVLALLDSGQAVERSQGAALLSTTVARCSRQRFVSSLLPWGSAAAAALRSEQGGSGRAALWPVLTAIFERAAVTLDVPGVRRDAAALAGKLLPIITPHLTGGLGREQHDGLEGMASALAAALRAVPAAFRQHVGALETFLAALVLGPPAGLPAGLQTRGCECLALLPRAAGDGTAWSALAQRLLRSTHAALDAAFQGLDDPALAAAAKGALQPDAQPLGSVRGPSEALSQAAALLETLERLLTAPFPAPVPMPAGGLLLLLTRILSMDDVANSSGRRPPSSAAYFELCLALPALHAAALQLLRTVLSVGGGTLCPMRDAVGRLLAGLMRRVLAAGTTALYETPTQARIALSEVSGEYLRTAGIGGARVLAADAVPYVLLELYGDRSSVTGGQAADGKEGGGAARPTKKQKRAMKAQAEELPSLAVAAVVAVGDVAARGNTVAEAAEQASAQAAALGLLAALLRVGGASMAASLRATADVAALHSSTAAEAAVEALQRGQDASTAPARRLQLAAYGVLAAAATVPGQGSRSAVLPAAIALLRRGALDPSPDLAAFSSQALLSIEGLLHPRAPPLQLRADVTAAVATGAAPLTLGPPRFWSAAMPAVPEPDESAAEGTEPDAMQGLEDVQGGSAHVGSSANAPVAGDQALVSALRATLDTVPDEQPVSSLATLQRAAAGISAWTHSAEKVMLGSDQAPPSGSEREQAMQDDQVVDIAAASYVLAPATSQAPLGAVPVPATNAVEAPAASALAVPSIFQDHAESDSEGPMPSIDSGPSDSESAE